MCCQIDFLYVSRSLTCSPPKSGELPDSLGECRRLEVLNLKSNRMIGTVPKAISMLTRLKYLDVDNNRITGEIPLPLNHSMNVKERHRSSERRMASAHGSAIGDDTEGIIESPTLKSRSLSGGLEK